MFLTLQAGRGLAALGVVLFHLSLMMGLARYGGQAVFGEFTRFGRLGVDFFFVLSGFIILFAHAKDIDRPEKWTTFAYRRFVRLFPVYWLYTAGFVTLVLMGVGNNAELPDDLLGWMSSITLLRFSETSPPLAVAWTLFHEMAFYAVFSTLILSRRLGLFILAIYMLVAIFYFQFPNELNRTPFKVYTSAYNLYFLFGMGAYWLHKQNGLGFVELLSGALIILVAAVAPPLPSQLSSFLIVMGFALLLAGAVKLERSGRFSVPVWLTLVGDASYSIYLTHLALTGALLKLTIKLHLLEVLGGPACYSFVLLATVVLGYGAYYVIERPLINWLRQFASPARQSSHISV